MSEITFTSHTIDSLVRRDDSTSSDQRHRAALPLFNVLTLPLWRPLIVWTIIRWKSCRFEFKNPSSSKAIKVELNWKILICGKLVKWVWFSFHVHSIQSSILIVKCSDMDQNTRYRKAVLGTSNWDNIFSNRNIWLPVWLFFRKLWLHLVSQIISWY